MSYFPVIDLKGPAFDLGLTHGRALAKSIAANYNTYLSMIAANTGMNESRIIELARLFVPVLGETAPWLLEEMRGMARGAKISLDSILVINLRTELGFPDQMAAECTTIGLTARRTEHGRPILAQNWDWLSAVKTGTALFRLQPARGQRALIFCEAGQVGKIGINESGVGVLLNILIGGGFHPGVPVHVLSRLILDASDAREAEDMVMQIQRASSSHFMVGDPSGRLRGLETAAQSAAVIEPSHGALIHTNHFCDPLLAKADRGVDLIPDSVDRLDRARQLIGGREKWAAEGLKTILADHSGSPFSICRHILPEQSKLPRIETLGSFIFDLGTCSAHVACGQPCRSSYQEISI